MPGIIAVISKKKGVPASEIAEDVSGVLYRRESYRRESAGAEGISLRLISGPKDSRGLVDNPDFICAWWGLPLIGGNELSSDDLGKSVFSPDNPADFLRKLQGHYQLVYYHKSRRECYIFADKISTHPHYYTETDDYIAVSPETLSLLALKKYGWNPTIREGAAYEFIANGFLWGDGTYLNEVERLGPGMYLVCSPEGMTKHQNWAMTFARKSARKSQLIDGLSSALDDDIARLPAGKAIITLSGGYDSRALLGLMKSADRDFETLSYNFGLPFTENSDAGVGKYFASKTGAVHHFHQADLTKAEILIRNIEDSICASGGESDTATSQDALLGADFYGGIAEKYDYILRGDEVWGWEDHVIGRRMAFYEATLINLDEIIQPGKLLKPVKYREGIDYILDQRDKYTSEFKGEFSDYDALKDILYFRHRQPRVIANMAYYRRCFIPHYAPFLFDTTVDFLKTIASKYRVNKNLFIELMKRRFPELFLDPNLPHSHGPKITKYEMLYSNPEFTGFLKKELLDEPSSLLARLFDEDRFSVWVSETLKPLSRSKKPAFEGIVKPNPLRSIAAKAVRRNRYLTARSKAFLLKHRAAEMPYSQSDASHLFRLAVLSLSLKKYEQQ